MQVADECWEHAERHWRELGKPLHIHRILLQRSWIAIFRGRYQDAIDMVEQARACLDESPRSSWLAYARLDDHLGSVWRADALADLGFDGAGEPDEDWAAAEARYRTAQGVDAAPSQEVPSYRTAMDKLARAADLKVPAALAVDSVRYSITEAGAQGAVGRVRRRAAAGRGVLRRLGVGEQRTDQRADRIPQRQRHVQRREPAG